VAANDIHHVDDEEALDILEDSLRPPKYDPLDFWNHIQSRVNNLSKRLYIYNLLCTVIITLWVFVGRLHNKLAM